MFRSIRLLRSSVTSKVQKRRDTFIKNKYPEYAGNEVSDPSGQSRKGRRLGGSFADTSNPLIKLDRSEAFYDTEDRQAIDAKFVAKLRAATKDPNKINAVIEEYTDTVSQFEATKEPISHERARKIKHVTSVDYATESKGIRPIKAAEVAPKIKRKPSKPESFIPLREEEEVQTLHFNIRESPAASFWSNHGAKNFIQVYSTSVPSVFSSTLSEYDAACKSSVVFDESFRYSIKVSGEDSVFVMDHFATAAIRETRIGDSVESCIVDSKGLVLTTATISRLSEIDFEILIDGFRESIFRYLAQYVVYSRQSGMDVSITPTGKNLTVSLYGPNAVSVLKHVLANTPSITLGELGDDLPSVTYLDPLPAMTVVTTDELMIRKKIDHFLVSTSGDFCDNFLTALVDSSNVVCGGAYALDMLRMERGIPRPEIDIPSATSSPVRTSLLWSVDQKKVREQTLFGHERISKELLRGTTHARVGLVANRYIYGGCKLLSSPHRHPIGEVTSCAWSPLLNKRVCQAYVKPEYAVKGNPVVVNVPLSVPESISPRFRKRIVKQGALQNVFRKLVSAEIVSFPISHS